MARIIKLAPRGRLSHDVLTVKGIADLEARHGFANQGVKYPRNPWAHVDETCSEGLLVYEAVIGDIEAEVSTLKVLGFPVKGSALVQKLDETDSVLFVELIVEGVTFYADGQRSDLPRDMSLEQYRELGDKSLLFFALRSLAWSSGSPPYGDLYWLDQPLPPPNSPDRATR